MLLAVPPHEHASRSHGGDATPSWSPLCIHGPADERRAEVEGFIRDVYARRYGAQVPNFAPVLVSVRAEGQLVAAAGYRAASPGPLFLERYLDAPVERLLARHVSAHASREDIVEVGHLAAARAGEGRRLILLLGPHLATQGFEWVVSTLTSELRHLFMRLGIAPLELGTAEPWALGDDAAHWGSYYEHRPAVLAGYLQQALRQLGQCRAMQDLRS
jgi:hypothetical protein